MLHSPPSATLYVDVDESGADGGTTGLYLKLGASHSFPVGHRLVRSVDLSGSLGIVNSGFGDYYYGSFGSWRARFQSHRRRALPNRRTVVGQRIGGLQRTAGRFQRPAVSGPPGRLSRVNRPRWSRHRLGRRDADPGVLKTDKETGRQGDKQTGRQGDGALELALSG